jgi:hypothetical protein
VLETNDDFALKHCLIEQNTNDLRKSFLETGTAIIRDFLSPSLLAAIVAETMSIIDHAYFNSLIGNAYLSALRPELSLDDPRNMTEETSLSVLAYDDIPIDHKLRTVYLSNALTDMVANIVGKEKLFPYACPLGALNVSVMKDNDYLRWHFDQCDFVVSIPLQDPLSGGQFQYVKDLRSEDHPNYEGVRDVLLGRYPNISSLVVPCGTLIVFRGLHTMHRVTKIYGDVPRLVALLSYADRPDCDSTDHLKMIRYGRTKTRFRH